MVLVALLKSNVMQKLDGINIKIPLKIQKHENLRKIIDDCFTWAVISNAPKNNMARKNLEVSYMVL